MAQPQQQTTNQAPSSSGGSGGLFGNASAAATVGDVGVGNATSGLRDLITGAKTFSFTGPVRHAAVDSSVVMYVVGGVFLFAALRKMKVL